MSSILVDLDDFSTPSPSPAEMTKSYHLNESQDLLDHEFLTDMFGDPATSEATVSSEEPLIDLN